MGAGCCKSSDGAVSPGSPRKKSSNNSNRIPPGVQQQQPQVHVRNINDQLPLHHHHHNSNNNNLQQSNGIRKQQRTNSTSTTTATSPTISGASITNNKNFNNISQNASPETLSISKNGVATIPNNNLVRDQNDKSIAVQQQDMTVITSDENDQIGDIKNVEVTTIRKHSSCIGQNKMEDGETADATNEIAQEVITVGGAVTKHSDKEATKEVVDQKSGERIIHEDSENVDDNDDDDDDETDDSDNDKNQFVSIVVPLADQNHLLALRRQPSDFQNFSAVLQQQQHHQLASSNNNININNNKHHENNSKTNYNISSTVGNDFESADLCHNNNNNNFPLQQQLQQSNQNRHSTASTGNSAEAAMTNTDETPSTLPDSQFSLGMRSDNSTASKCFFKNMSSHALSLPLCIHNNIVNNPDNPALQEAMLLAKPCSSYFRGMEGIFYCVGDVECPVVSANPCEQVWGGGFPSKQTIAICEKEISYYHLTNSSANRALSASHSSHQQQQVKLEDVMSKSSRETEDTVLSSSNNKQQHPNDDADEFRRATECLSPREKNSNVAVINPVKNNSNVRNNNSNSPSPTHHTDVNRSPKILFSVAAGGNGSIPSNSNSAASQQQQQHSAMAVAEESTTTTATTTTHPATYFVTAKRTPPDAKQSCIYTADSPPCRCARHAGVIGKYGGVFIVVSRPGQQQYQGSARRGGIVSHSHGVYDLSIEICAIGK